MNTIIYAGKKAGDAIEAKQAIQDRKKEKEKVI